MKKPNGVMRRSTRRSALSLPYGIWKLEDHSEVMFNRAYEAMYLRRPHSMGLVTKCSGEKRVPRISQRHFHIGGIVNMRLYRELLQIERDFIAGGDLEGRFWKPDEKPTVPNGTVEPTKPPERPYLRLVR
jgi:hypothetical protein